MLITTIFLVSLSTLAFEVLLARVFSIGQWNHLSFMVISIALFGFAASGTFLSILEGRNKAWSLRLSGTAAPATISLLFTFTALFSFLALTALPLDYFRLPIQPAQSVYLMTAYILLALPFFFSGLLIALGYAAAPQKSGLIYFATMGGSACGAALPAILLPWLGEERLLIASVSLPLVFSLFFGLRHQPMHQRSAVTRIGPAICAVILILCAGLLMSPMGSAIISVTPSPYKALSQILQFPNTTVVESTTGIRGRNERVKTPHIRFAPGISLKYTQALPQQHAIFRDGDNQFVFYHLSSPGDAQFAMHTVSFCGYHLVSNPEDVLVIENNGGLAIACALASGASNVKIAVNNPHIARAVQHHYHLPAINRNPRAYLAQTDEKFQVIQVEDWGTSIPGSDALNQHHLLSIDAFSQYIKHLTPDGVVVVSRRLLLPPANTVRLWATAYESLKQAGIRDPRTHMAMLRNWDTFTLIVSAAPLDDPEKIIQFARDRNFDVVFLPEVNRDDVNRFNIYDAPFHFNEIDQLAKAYSLGKQKTYLNQYLLDVVPQSDNRPFPGRFLKWHKLKALYKSMGSRLYGLLMSGEIVVFVVFLEALLVSILLLFVPQVMILKNRRRPAGFRMLYFFGAGIGFMFVELFFIKRFIILFGDPVISFTVVLCGVLAFSGLGGLWAQTKKITGIRYAMIALVAVLAITAATADLIIGRMLALTNPWRYLGAFLFLLPAGFLMGLPFPLGMRWLLPDPAQRSYAWSVNGCASVLASIAAAQIALSFGIAHIMGLAILAYIVTLLCVPKQPKISDSNS